MGILISNLQKKKKILDGAQIFISPIVKFYLATALPWLSLLIFLEYCCSLQPFGKSRAYSMSLLIILEIFFEFTSLTIKNIEENPSNTLQSKD